MFLSSEEFMRLAKAKVYEMALASLCPTDDLSMFTINDVYIVTHAFILKNQKAMVSTTLKDGKYYEVTYNEATSELYVDQYVKVQNKSYNVEEILNKQKPIKNDEVTVQPLYGCPIPNTSTEPDENIHTNPDSYYYGIPKESKPADESDSKFPIIFPNNNEDGHISLDEFVKHVKHEHPDYFPANEKFIENECKWRDGIKRNIQKRALVIYGERSLALLMDADNQSFHDIKYFHINVSEDAYSDFVCVGKVANDELFRHVVKTLYHMDWTANDSHQTLWTGQIADMLGISQDKVTDFIVH
jgi:hypothetical protein